MADNTATKPKPNSTNGESPPTQNPNTSEARQQQNASSPPAAPEIENFDESDLDALFQKSQ